MALSVSSRKALDKLAAEIGLRDAVVHSQQKPIVVTGNDGALHAPHSPCTRRLGLTTSISATRLSSEATFSHAHVCRDCERVITWELVPPELRALLGAHQLAKRVVRSVERPRRTTSARTAGTVRRKLADYRGELARTVPAQHHWALTLVLAEVEQALRTLDSSRSTDEARERELNRIEAELTSRARNMKLAREQHLIGIYPPLNGTAALDATLAVFAVESSEHQILLAPRFVADYVLREMYRACSFPVVVSIPAPDATAEHAQVVASLWAPREGGPMADLATAYVASEDAMATPAGR